MIQWRELLQQLRDIQHLGYAIMYYISVFYRITPKTYNYKLYIVQRYNKRKNVNI